MRRSRTRRSPIRRSPIPTVLDDVRRSFTTQLAATFDTAEADTAEAQGLKPRRARRPPRRQPPRRPPRLPVSWAIYWCSYCGSSALGGPEEIIHLNNQCLGKTEGSIVMHVILRVAAIAPC